jgi:hypothetical protein
MLKINNIEPGVLSCQEDALGPKKDFRAKSCGLTFLLLDKKSLMLFRNMAILTGR